MKLEDGATNLSTILETVRKDYNIGNRKAENASVPSEDRIWLLSNSEIFPKNAADDRYAYSSTQEGEQYKYYKLVTNNAAWNEQNSGLKKYAEYAVDTNLSNSSQWWWLRSPYYDGYGGFCYIDGNGYGANGNLATKAGGIAPGFCI